MYVKYHNKKVKYQSNLKIKHKTNFPDVKIYKLKKTPFTSKECVTLVIFEQKITKPC